MEPQLALALRVSHTNHLSLMQGTEETAKRVRELMMEARKAGATNQEIGDVLGVTRQRVSQILGRT